MTTSSKNYIVLNENTLGLIHTQRPQWMEVLAGSVIRGGHSHMNGPVYVSRLDTQRPATLADFEAYRVCPKGHIA